MSTYEVDPISRIEGHLGVTITESGGSIAEADVHGNLWRGFENFLIGREINDAITFTQRICGVCPLPHATASMFAVDACFGYSPGYMTFAGAGASDVPASAAYVRNLVYAAEFIMSHITHFYHLAAPSYVQGPGIPPWTPYFADSYYNTYLTSLNKGVDVTGDSYAEVPSTVRGFSANLWSAVIKSYVKALRMRRLTFEAGALFAGRMPMVASFVAGGTTNKFSGGGSDLDEKCNLFYSMFSEIGAFIFTEYIPIVLALATLYPDYDNTSNTHISTKALFGSGNPQGYGGGYGNFLAWGAFPNPSTDVPDIKGGFKFGSGSDTSIQLMMSAKADLTTTAISVTATDGSTVNATGVIALVGQALTEDVDRSRYVAAESWGYSVTAGGTAVTAAYPGDITRTEPDRTDSTKYSWLKSPRWLGEPMEVGPFARMVVNSWYPVDGVTALIDSGLGWPAGFAKPATYVRATNGYTGLKPELVGADLAVALVREGLCHLVLTGTAGSPGADLVVERSLANSLAGTTITTAYTNPSALGYTQGVIVDGTANAATLISDIAGLKGGVSTLDRLRGRGLEAAVLVQLMIGAFDGTQFGSGSGTNSSSGWIGALANSNGQTYPTTPRSNPTSSSGVKMGVSEAPRGALAHFATVAEGKISAYQCVVPTTWNACPKDGNGKRGPMEQAMIGAPFAATNSPFTPVGGGSQNAVGGVEPLRVAQSFDPCIACAVH